MQTRMNVFCFMKRLLVIANDLFNQLLSILWRNCGNYDELIDNVLKKIARISASNDLRFTS